MTAEKFARTFVVLLASALAVGSASADTIIPGGNLVSQTWTRAGNPYIVQGDITVPAGAVLTITSGTIVQFASTDAQASGLDPAFVEMTIQGALNVAGTVLDPVVFQAKDGTAPGTWYGIVIAPGAATAVLDNVSIQQSVIAMSDNAGVLRLTHAAISSFFDTGLSLAAPGSRCQFLSIAGGGTGIVSAADSVSVDAATITGNIDGIEVLPGAGLLLSNAVIYGNDSAGILVDGAHLAPAFAPVSIVNSTIYGNGGTGVDLNVTPTSSNCAAACAANPPGVEVTNSIIATNGSGGVRNQSTCSCSPQLNVPVAEVLVGHSDIWNNTGFQQIGTSDQGGSLSVDPQFVAPPTDLHLAGTSACIDAGTSTGAPDHDRDGKSRPVNGDGVNGAAFDVGAYEFSPSSTTTSSSTSTSTTSTSSSTARSTSTSSSSTSSSRSTTSSSSSTSSSAPPATSSTTSSSSTVSSTTSTTVPCAGGGFSGALCELDTLHPAELCAPEVMDARLQQSIVSKIGQVRGLLRNAQLKAGSNKTNTANRLLATARRQLSVIVKKAKQAAKQVKRKPPRISGACFHAVEQQVTALQTSIGGLRL